MKNQLSDISSLFRLTFELIINETCNNQFFFCCLPTENEGEMLEAASQYVSFVSKFKKIITSDELYA